MSVWARTLVYLGLREEDDDAVDWQVVEDAGGAAAAAGPVGAAVGGRPLVAPRAGASAERAARTDATGASAGPATPATPATPGTAAAQGTSNVRKLHTGLDMVTERVTVVHVRVFDEVETIGSRYRLRQPVLFDVSACTREVARRTVDFVSGLTYASGGSLRRTAPRAFLLVPEGVDLPLDERRRLAQLGYDVDGTV